MQHVSLIATLASIGTADREWQNARYPRPSRRDLVALRRETDDSAFSGQPIWPDTAPIRARRFLNASGDLLAAVVLIGGGMHLIGLAAHF